VCQLSSVVLPCFPPLFFNPSSISLNNCYEYKYQHPSCFDDFGGLVVSVGSHPVMSPVEGYRYLTDAELLGSLIPWGHNFSPSVSHAVLKAPWELLDGEQLGTQVLVPSGHYLLQRMPNPFGYAAHWYVLAGTSVGMTCSAWAQWVNGGIDKHGKPINWGVREIILYVGGKKFPPLNIEVARKKRMVPVADSRPPSRKIPSMLEVPLLEQHELDALAACRSEQQWIDVCFQVTSKRGGAFPSDWHARVMCGLKQKVFKRWE